MKARPACAARESLEGTHLPGRVTNAPHSLGYLRQRQDSTRAAGASVAEDGRTKTAGRGAYPACAARYAAVMATPCPGWSQGPCRNHQDTHGGGEHGG